MNKFFLYARKSPDEPDRQILSIEAQIHELKEFAEREHLEIMDTFIESQTAKEPGRPIFNQMLSLIEKGKANGVVAWHPFVSRATALMVGVLSTLSTSLRWLRSNFRLFGLNPRHKANLCSQSLSGRANTMLIIFQRM